VECLPALKTSVQRAVQHGLHVLRRVVSVDALITSQKEKTMKVKDLILMMTMTTDPNMPVSVELIEGMLAIVKGENPFETVVGKHIEREGTNYFREDVVAELARDLGAAALMWCGDHQQFHAIADQENAYAALVAALAKQGAVVERNSEPRWKQLVA
jgi:hypothetical protein